MIANLPFAMVGSLVVSLSLLTWIATYPTADAGAEPVLIAADPRPIKVWAEFPAVMVMKLARENRRRCPEWSICPSPPKPEL